MHTTAEDPQDDPGHLLPDDDWQRVVDEARAHPDNPHNPANDRTPDPS